MVKVEKISCLGIILIFSVVSGLCQSNHSILIGIDTYKNSNDWPLTTSLEKNIKLVKDYFENSRLEFNTNYFLNKEATKKNIIKNFPFLLKKINPGDRVVIYMTGHGSQIEDIEPFEEKDKMDEIFVCFDSPPNEDKYYEEFRNKSISDDLLNDLLNKLRLKLGPNGQVFLIIESCHSGTIDKGDGVLPIAILGEENFSFFEKRKEISTETLAPLITFSSSRSSDETASVYGFTKRIIETLKNFTRGSYKSLFYECFYSQTETWYKTEGFFRDPKSNVNLSVDHPEFLNYGFLESKVYSPTNEIRVVNIKNSDYSLVLIDKGIFEMMTIGSEIIFEGNQGYQLKGKVDSTYLGYSWVRINKKLTKDEIQSIFKTKGRVSKYRYVDKIQIYVSPKIVGQDRQKIIDAIDSLPFIHKGDGDRGYKIEKYNQDYYIIRFAGNVALYKLRLDELRNVLLKMQISKFIRTINTSEEPNLSLVPKYKNRHISTYKTMQEGNEISLFVRMSPSQKKIEKYYAILQFEDEFIKQLVPVNFQINESECKIVSNPTKAVEIPIGTVTVGRMDGKFMLITSDNPFDLREVLLNPISKEKSDGKNLHELERLIKELFMNRSDSSGLYDPSSIKTQVVTYRSTGT